MTTRPPTHVLFPSLSGGGEMGERIRAFDWSATPVGPVESWPASLRTTINLLLNSRYPMFLWWGREKINFYNDGYIPVLGARHPDALGRRAPEIWSEIWDVVGPLADTVLQEGRATWNEQLLLVMERYGFTEETYFTFSYSPAFTDDGTIGGVFCACIEDTRQVIGGRRLKTLGELAARAVDVTSAEQACEAEMRALAVNPHDVPFALLYFVEEKGGRATLAGTTGVQAGTSVAPLEVDLSQESGPWPLCGVTGGGDARVVEDVVARIGPVVVGPWPEPVERAIVLPLQQPAQSGPAGLLVLGLSPRLAFDDEYRGFCNLVAGQVATALADARAQEAERRRAEALAELDRAKTAFFSNVSHELRTPLTLMLGPVDELLSHGSSLANEPARAELETVRRNARRLLKLVNMLLDFSRVEAGRLQASYEPVDLAGFTSELASVFRSAMERAGLTFTVTAERLREPVYVDRQLWEKIVLNLLSNALKFTFTGSVDVRMSGRGDSAELTIADTGTGVPADEIPRLFERFHRVHGARARTLEGSGIGLALVQELVRMHGGSIGVTSEEGVGTTFTVTLPFGRAHLPADRVQHPSERSDQTIGEAAGPYIEEALGWLGERRADGGPAESGLPATRLALPMKPAVGRILVADDNADMRAYLCRLLESRWNVVCVADGLEALEEAHRQPPDAVVADIMMPRLDGLGLLRALREDESLRAVPVILLSARAGEEAHVEGLAAGADDYLVKPFSARELIARIERQIMRTWLRSVEAAHNQKLVDTFRDAPVPVAILEGPSHVYTFANDPYLQLVPRRQLIGRPIREALPELADQGIFELLDAVYYTGKTFRSDSVRVVLNRGPVGEAEEAFFKLTYQPMFDATGQVEGVVVVAVEVTELARARREAEAANRAKDEFLAMLGHELRNPLAPILTALQLMRLRGDGGERERAVIERQVKHVVGLVDDLLDVSRITRGKITLQRRRVSLADVVARAVEMVSPLLEQQQHQLSVEVPRTGCDVDGDHNRLAQVVANLLTNAAKYTSPGGQIALTATAEAEEVVLRVRDNGVGIAADMLPIVFDLFAQERQDSARAAGGLGLGLAIVRNLVQLHGGTVSAHSEGRGLGSAFVIRLPRLQSVLVPEASPERPPAVAIAENGRRRILVVDDNRDAAGMLMEALQLIGHEVRTAGDGLAALRVAEEFVPDIALLDLGLPVMDGYELANQFRARPMLAQTRLIAITGYGQPVDRRRTADSGFAAHLVKPVDLDRLKDVLEGVVAEEDALE